MTLDDDNSIYVGGLPYDASEEDLRRAFNFYGKVVAVKIINDRDVGGKCFGFVTFTNPRSAIDAIHEMNGKTIGGRVVRVNEVRQRGSRPAFHRENFHWDAERDREWDRDGDHIRDRERFRDRNTERPRDRDRERDYERGRDFDRARGHSFDRVREHSGHGHGNDRDHDRDWERDRDMDWEEDREIDKTRNNEGSRDKEQQSRNRLGARPDDHRRREMSSNSSDEYPNQAKEELEMFIQKSEELQQELKLINGNVDEREQAVSELQKKCEKLEDALIAARKLSSHRQSTLAKLNRYFMQVQEHSERLKSSEHELKILVDTAMTEVGVGDEVGARDGSTYANGQV